MSTQNEDPNTTTEHPVDRAARAMGGRDALATVLGVKRSAPGNWKVRGVPIEHCAAIELACGGVVTRRELRPNDWKRIWPELAAYQATLDAQPALKAVDGVAHA